MYEDTIQVEQAENLVRYVEDGRYDASWINRADENFVLQMGGFYSHTRRPPITIESTHDTAAKSRPEEVSAPLVPPPCVYSPHGAPKTRAAWKAATIKKMAAASHAATRVAIPRL